MKSTRPCTTVFTATKPFSSCSHVGGGASVEIKRNKITANECKQLNLLYLKYSLRCLLKFAQFIRMIERICRGVEGIPRLYVQTFSHVIVVGSLRHKIQQACFSYQDWGLCWPVIPGGASACWGWLGHLSSVAQWSAPGHFEQKMQGSAATPEVDKGLMHK